MFVGQILQARVQPILGNRQLFGQVKVFSEAIVQGTTLREDKVEIGTNFSQDVDIGLYRPNGNQMRILSSVSCTKVESDEKLQNELLPPSEQSSYTEKDALINQYMKQSRIEGYFEGDTFVRTSTDPVKLILKDQISEQELESLKSELVEKGLGNEIDWHKVASDLSSMNVGFDNIENFEKKTDYLASRYAVLKDRIQTQFTGDKQETELQKLEQLYTDAKEEMANSFAESIGGFYESLGQSGTIDEMRNSVLAVIDGKAKEYANYLRQNDIYAKIDEPDDQWLKQDDAYMAAQLRESVLSVQNDTQTESINSQAPYSEKDLTYAGIYARDLLQQLEKPQWDTFTLKENDSDLGKYLAEQYKTVSDEIDNAGISDKLSNMLKNSFEPFIEKFMNALDAKIDQNRQRVAENLWQTGLIRTDYIDRSSIYDAFQNAIVGM